MGAGDELRKARSSGYMDGKFTDKTGGKDGNDPDEENSTSRTIKLSDEEMKSLEPHQVKPGEELLLEVSGSLESDGHFHVMTVKYSNGTDEKPMMDSEQQLADMVAQKVQPRLQISPS